MESLDILGWGFAVPSGRRACGVHTIPSAVPVSTLADPAYAAPAARVSVLSDTPSALAAQALQSALLHAGKESTSLSLLIGDTVTPLQTTPGEAQRTGEKLGLKVPAFDIVAGSVGLLHHIDTVRRWKAERTGGVISALSTAVSSQRLGPDSEPEGVVLGDGAGALLLSTGARGRLSVVHSATRFNTKLAELFYCDRFSPIRVSSKLREVLMDEVRLLVTAERYRIGTIDSLIVASPFVGDGPRYGELVGVAPERVLTPGTSYGHSFGSEVVAALPTAGHSGERLMLLSCGAGLSVGIVVLEVR